MRPETDLRAWLTRRGAVTAVRLGEPSVRSAERPHDVRRLGRYPIVGSLGSGGMGEVLQVLDEDLGRIVAAKVIRGEADRRLVEKFVLEAQVTGQLEHPNIVPVYELGLAESERIYFTMRRVPGEDLARTLEREQEGPTDAEAGSSAGWDRRRLGERLRVFLKVCDAIEYAHSRGVIHRDLKPSNIMVGRFGEVQVMDWGLAAVLCGSPAGDPFADDLRPSVGAGRIAEIARGGRDVEPLKTMRGDILGTPTYMPPEQARGQIERIDERADVYALGAILYEIVTGDPPYTGETGHQVVAQLLSGPPVRPSERAPSRGVPWELDAVIVKAMEHDLERRYSSVGALRTDLERFIEGGLLSAVRYTRRQRVARWLARRWKPLTAAAGVLLPLAVLLGYHAASTAEKARLADLYLAQRDRARGRREEAGRQRDAAVSARADLLRMSDLHRLAKLTAEGDALWPAHRRMVQRYRAWLLAARRLAANLPLHRTSLAKLRQQGRQAGAPWTFDDAGRQWVHDNLAALVTRLERFGEPHGMLANVSRRLARAETVWQRSVEAHRRRWEHASTAIRRSDRYGSLQLPPQEGLVPIGPDPTSRLWEFWVLDTGRLVQRLPGGRLAFDGASAVVLVLLPGGTFHIGARRGRPLGPNVDPLASKDEAPVHQVRLAPFFISKFELTQGQWQRIAGANPSHRAAGELGVTLDHPVEMVSWHDCRQTLGRFGMALPSEAQWEYAARGGTRSRWWTGNERESVIGSANLADRAFARKAGAARFERWDDGHPYHAPVGLFRANPFGLHDVIGNVVEWCSDPYHARAYELPLVGDGSGRRRYPPGWLEQQSERGRVVRGGAFDTFAKVARSTYRNWYPPTPRIRSIGCRSIRKIDAE